MASVPALVGPSVIPDVAQFLTEFAGNFVLLAFHSSCRRRRALWVKDMMVIEPRSSLSPESRDEAANRFLVGDKRTWKEYGLITVKDGFSASSVRKQQFDA
jgi:hypothetical protein